MAEGAGKLAGAIGEACGRIGRPVRLMEVCGTHTVAIFRHGLRDLIPESVRLLSGPGCPVCVTSARDIDRAIAMALEPGVVLATFGDMMAVPGTRGTLYGARAAGADVRAVYSPMDALGAASAEAGRKFVFLATGFETTAPLVAATLLAAEREGVGNFFVYPVHKLVPPALEALLGSGETSLDGLILPGHVSAVIGSRPYEFLAGRYGVPSVVTGFGAEDILEGILMILAQIVSGRAEVEVQYRSVVRPEGNPRALEAMYECFEPVSAYWRGIGPIERSGLGLRAGFGHRDAFGALPGVHEAGTGGEPEPAGCSCGEVLRGLKVPTECALFGRRCTPESPVGPCMVSAEGSCAAYYKYGGWDRGPTLKGGGA